MQKENTQPFVGWQWAIQSATLIEWATTCNGEKEPRGGKDTTLALPWPITIVNGHIPVSQAALVAEDIARHQVEHLAHDAQRQIDKKATQHTILCGPKNGAS